MVEPSAGDVILVPFPFSDLSRSKLRPALVLANVGRGDWILCQITSNPYSDPRAVDISKSDFRIGSLPVRSYARPGKLFTANQDLYIGLVGELNFEKLEAVITAVVKILQDSLLAY